jgi:hypothetical protein
VFCTLSRGVLRLFPGCFEPPGCFAQFSVVFCAAGCSACLPTVFFCDCQTFPARWQGVLFSGGVLHQRDITHFFPGYFTPQGCYTHFPGVFRSNGVLRILSGGVSHRRGVSCPIAECFVFRGCFAPTGYYAFIPGVFHAAGVLHPFSGGSSIQRGVTHSFRGYFTPPGCFLPDSRVFCFPGVFLIDGVLRMFSGGVSRRQGVTYFSRGCTQRWGETRGRRVKSRRCRGVIRIRGVSPRRRPGRYVPTERYVPDVAGCFILVTPVEGVSPLQRPCYTTSKVS